MKTLGDRRTWNDDQLRQAVADNPSWSAVARALGLKGTSAGVIRTIKRHAARLELDTTHFTGQRRWSDGQLRRVLLGSTCWAEVLDGLGVIDNGENRVRVKGHAARLGLDCTHLKKRERPETPEDRFNQPMRPEMLRCAASALAMAWFSLRGCAAGSIYVIPSSVLAGRVAIDAETYAPYRVGDASSLMQ
ncbi:hypothetical protein [Kribbella antiqua]|uniref:hypothetical protein n=1 Tax=Kribbella antiqua TaxID=2512217 RepID=UPI00105163F2|nr:hypothetical protein [Kribbella antiqua]